MSDIKWIKLSTNMFNDEKIKLIRTMPEGDKIIVTWVQLLCLAGKTNDHGGIYMGQNIHYTDEMLATLCDQPVNIMRIALKTLEQFGMVECLDNGLIQIVNWEKHQSTDKMSRMKEQTRIRQQKHYYRNKLRELGMDVDKQGFTDDLEDLKNIYSEYEEPNVRLTLPNDTEVRSKKLEERGKKKEERSKKDTTTGSGDDSVKKFNALSSFEQLWAFPNFVQKEDLNHLIDQNGDDLVTAAVKLAGSKDVKKGQALSFIESALREWADNNVKTVDQAREYQKNRNKQFKKSDWQKNRSSHNRQESLPDWANKDYKAPDEKWSEEKKKEKEKEKMEWLARIRAKREQLNE